MSHVVCIRRSAVFVAVAGMLACSTTAAGSAGPPAALVQAIAQTNGAKSLKISFVERVSAGSNTTIVRLKGVEQPQQHGGSFVFSTSPAQAGLGQASEILHGSKVYVHYGVLDALHKKDPRVKSWLVVDTTSSLGINPEGFTTLGATGVKELKGIKVVDKARDAGVPVTRYSGTLDLRQAAQSPVLQELLAHLPSSVAAILSGTERIALDVGDDGFVHRITTSLTLPLGGTQAISISIDVMLTDFNRPIGAIIPPPSSEVMTLTQFDKLTGAGTAAADAALVGKVVLRPSQVGAGYTLSQIPGGQLVQGEPTLDFCGLKYPSEALRTARLQVTYAKNGSFLASNEVVTYQPGDAKQALREIVHAAGACPNGRVKGPASGVTNFVRHTSVLHVSGLLPGSVAILDVESGTVNGKRVTTRSVEIFQVRGNVLSAVYGRGPSTASLETNTVHAAQQSAANLKRELSTAGALTA